MGRGYQKHGGTFSPLHGELLIKEDVGRQEERLLLTLNAVKRERVCVVSGKEREEERKRGKRREERGERREERGGRRRRT